MLSICLSVCLSVCLCHTLLIKSAALLSEVHGSASAALRGLREAIVLCLHRARHATSRHATSQPLIFFHDNIIQLAAKCGPEKPWLWCRCQPSNTLAHMPCACPWCLEKRQPNPGPKP
jgi:hypothetical protein